MTSSTSARWAQGWNRPSETGEKCLHVYVAADGTLTGYFKGRLNGKVESRRLDGDTLTEWKKEVRLLRSDDKLVESLAGDKRLTVEAYVPVFIEQQRVKINHANPNMRRSRRSVENDVQRLNKFVVGSRLGRTKFADVKLASITAFVQELYKLRQADGKPYAENTLRDVVRILGALFRQAKRDGKITFNPVRELERDERPSSTVVNAKRSLTTKQVDALLAASGDSFRPLLTLCAWTGLRIRECLGLVWGDLDLEAGTMAVMLQLDTDGTRIELKTKNSRASVPLLPKVVEALRAHRKAMQERGIHLIRDEAFVFVTAAGRPQNPRNVLRALHRAGDVTGLNVGDAKKVDLHSLRHSLSSNLINGGMPLPKVASIVRNDVETLARHYATVPEEQRGERLATDMRTALRR